MKILIVQLSDMHCTKDDITLTSKIRKAVRALRVIGKVDGALLVFSGDIADKGTHEEYQVARKLMHIFVCEMSATLKCGFIPSKIVPGNHDIVLPEDCRKAEDILSWKKSEHLEEEINRMSAFFEYAKPKRCFTKNSFCDIDTVPFGDLKIQICLLNSAPFSTRKATDKELHYLPQSVAEQLVRQEDVDLKLTVMHHHYEWCEWNTKQMLIKAIASDDLTFFGHDHKAETISSEHSGGEKHNILMGGRFFLDVQKEAAFNAVVFDSEMSTLQCYEFSWVVEQNLFIHKATKPIHTKKRGTLHPSEEYLSQLLRDEQNISQSFVDYYALPKLSAEGSAFSLDETSEEITVETIFNVLQEDRVVRITGGEGTGKSALLKYLYYQSLDRGFIPIMVENRDYRDSRIDKMFRDLFEEQYESSGEYAYEYYLQLDGNKKIVFIDNLDLISNIKAKENLVNSILESGRLLVYTTKDKNQNLEEIVKNRLQNKTISTVSINPTYKETRDSLVVKIGQILNKSNVEIESIKLLLDHLVQSQTSLFSFTPGNTIQYIKYFLTGGAREKGAHTISLVFETNIRNAIIAACKKDYVANKYLLALEYIANSMYFSLRAETIDLDTYRRIIAEYNEKKKGDINEKEFLECCIKARIIRDFSSSFNIGFYDKNTYAYFVAKALNRDFEKNRLDSANLLYVMEHICFGINDTIVLFLSFIRSNTSIITKIAEEAMNLLEGYPQWDIKLENIPFLHKTEGLPEKAPSKREQKESHKQVEQVERERHQRIKFRGIFDFNEDDVKKSQYLIVRALKYAQLVGRALVDQYGALDANEIDIMLQAIYSVPQKVIYATLKPYQDHYEEIVQDIKEFADRVIPEEKFTEQKIRDMFGQAGTVLALNIMNDIAFNCSNEGTISVLRTVKTDSTNDKILQLMMEENSGNTPEFISRAISLRKELEAMPYARTLIAQIARKHIIYTQSIDHRQVDKLLDGRVLAVESKPSLLLSKGSGVSENK